MAWTTAETNRVVAIETQNAGQQTHINNLIAMHNGHVAKHNSLIDDLISLFIQIGANPQTVQDTLNPNKL